MHLRRNARLYVVPRMQKGIYEQITIQLKELKFRDVIDCIVKADDLVLLGLFPIRILNDQGFLQDRGVRQTVL